MTGREVLVVDDSRGMQTIIGRVLEMAGVPAECIATASNGREALERMSVRRPSLLITDITMPVMDGVALLTALSREDWTRDLPIVVVTSASDVLLPIRLLRLGVDRIVRKPFSPADLDAQLAAFVEGRDWSIEASLPEIPPSTDESPTVGGATLPWPSGTLEMLDSVVSDTVERLAYMTCRPTLAEPRCCTLVLEAAVDLLDPREENGPQQTLAMFASAHTCDRFLDAIVGQLGGPAPDIDDRARADVLGEVLNVVAGAWLHARGREGDPGAKRLVLSPPRLDVHLPRAAPARTRQWCLDETFPLAMALRPTLRRGAEPTPSLTAHHPKTGPHHEQNPRVA